ncbi:hypothetical protein BJX99DRAFT_237425 [Aspergillus californicus]
MPRFQCWFLVPGYSSRTALTRNSINHFFRQTQSPTPNRQKSQNRVELSWINPPFWRKPSQRRQIRSGSTTEVIACQKQC